MSQIQATVAAASFHLVDGLQRAFGLEKRFDVTRIVFVWIHPEAIHLAGHHQALASLPDEAGNTASHTRPGACQEDVALFDFNHRTRLKTGRKEFVVLGLKLTGLNRSRFQNAPNVLRWRRDFVALRTPALVQRASVLQRSEELFDSLL